MSSTGGDLPQQIIVDDILPRLPAKSLCRFKSVSKPWRALISDPHFLKAHLTRHTTTTPDTLIIVSPTGSLFSLHFDQSLTATATKLDIPSPEHPIEWVNVFGSCNGLLLLSNKLETDETFRDVPPPSSLDNIKMVLYDLTVLGGCLCMFPLHLNSEEISVWVMKEYGVVESWTEFKIIRPNNVAKIVPLCMLRDGKVLLEMDGCELVAYNPEEGRGRVTVVHGYSGSIRSCATYADSLVSPNGVARQDSAFRRGPNMDLSSMYEISMAKEGTYEAGSTSSSNIIEASSSVTDPFSLFNGLDCFIGMDVPEEQTSEEEDVWGYKLE